MSGYEIGLLALVCVAMATFIILGIKYGRR